MYAWHIVAISDLESHPECVHRAYLNSDDTWNGWACPYFEKPEVERMTEWRKEHDFVGPNIMSCTTRRRPCCCRTAST